MRHAILIASATFDPDSGIELLRFPPNDVAALSNLFKTEDFKFDRITPVIDQPRQIVVDTIDEILNDSAFDDFLLIYFSGHGKLNAKGDLFLSCRNTKEKTLNGTGLKYSHLMEMLDAHRADRVAIILDCCYAGRAVSGFRGSVPEQIISQLDSGRGIFVLGASGATQTAEEREIDGHGIFTKQVIEGLQSGAADVDGDGQISLNDLAKYVRDEFRRKNISQDPFMAGLVKSGDLFLGTNRKQKHKRMIVLISSAIEQAKGHFSRATYRNIEDYLDEIADRPDAEQDPRFKALAAYKSGNSLEDVIDAFRLRDKAPLITGDEKVVENLALYTREPPVSIERPILPQAPTKTYSVTQQLLNQNFATTKLVGTIAFVGIGILLTVFSNAVPGGAFFGIILIGLSITLWVASVKKRMNS